MENKKPEMSNLELSYFELQAYIGTTKHIGGFETTKTLIELCHIDKDTCVLDVGCGVGATACYLAKKYGCRVVGVDLRESMVALSDERAQREGVREFQNLKPPISLSLYPFDKLRAGCQIQAQSGQNRPNLTRSAAGSGDPARAGGRIISLELPNGSR